MIRVEVIRAWPHRAEAATVELSDDATVADALSAVGWDAPAISVFGERATPSTRLVDGDRVEVLRPLVADPKEARRRRATPR